MNFLFHQFIGVFQKFCSHNHQLLRLAIEPIQLKPGEAVDDDANEEGGFTTNPNGKAVEAALV